MRSHERGIGGQTIENGRERRSDGGKEVTRGREGQQGRGGHRW
jgi:hypothetical protein